MGSSRSCSLIAAKSEAWFGSEWTRGCPSGLGMSVKKVLETAENVGKVTNLPKAEEGSISESKDRILLVPLTNSEQYCRWSRGVGISEQNS